MRRVVLAVLLHGGVVACHDSPEDKYDKCVQRAAQAPTDAGVTVATENCAKNFEIEKERERISVSKVETGVAKKVFWDGWNFKAGEIPENLKGKGYYEYSFARYGVVICKIAMPKAMGSELFNPDGTLKPNEPLNNEFLNICQG